VFHDRCDTTDPALLFKTLEVPGQSEFFALQHSSGKCVRPPKKHNQPHDNDELVLADGKHTTHVKWLFKEVRAVYYGYAVTGFARLKLAKWDIQACMSESEMQAFCEKHRNNHTFLVVKVDRVGPQWFDGWASEKDSNKDSVEQKARTLLADQEGHDPPEGSPWQAISSGQLQGQAPEAPCDEVPRILPANESSACTGTKCILM